MSVTADTIAEQNSPADKCYKRKALLSHMIAREGTGPGACGLSHQQHQQGWVETSLPEVLPLGTGEVVLKELTLASAMGWGGARAALRSVHSLKKHFQLFAGYGRPAARPLGVGRKLQHTCRSRCRPLSAGPAMSWLNTRLSLSLWPMPVHLEHLRLPPRSLSPFTPKTEL